jgi:hypothetical protein
MILTYKEFIVEGLFDIVNKDKEEIIKNIETSFEEIKFFKDFIKQNSIDNILNSATNKNLPKTVKDSIIYLTKLFYDEEFPYNYERLLEFTKEKLESGMNPEEVQKEEVYIELMKTIEGSIRRVLKIKGKELDELLDKFSLGMKKYKKDKEESTKIIPEDPYGEEDWGNEEDRWERAFSDDN